MNIGYRLERRDDDWLVYACDALDHPGVSTEIVMNWVTGQAGHLVDWESDVGDQGQPVLDERVMRPVLWKLREVWQAGEEPPAGGMYVTH